MQILFRAKKVNGGDWVEGYYVQQYGSFTIYLPNGTDENGFDYYHIVFKTLGQFTGLVDAHGNKVFNGDIVRVSYNNKSVNGIVNYHTDNACYLITIRKYNRHLYPFNHPEMIVIGNIHDNPELLED